MMSNRSRDDFDRLMTGWMEAEGRVREPEDLIEQVPRLLDAAIRLHPARHEPVEVVARAVRHHAGRPSFNRGLRASASRAARIAAIARWRRERTVPGGTRRTSAASSRLNPR